MTRFDATDRRPVDKWTAAPRPTTSPQGQQPQQKRSTHMVHKPVNSECSRQNVTKQKLGFDFVFTKGRKTRHVEVKGTSGAVARFFMTRNENAYRENRPWRFAIVTNALDSNPKVRIYNNRQFNMAFNLDPYVFIGKPASMPDSL